MGNGNDYSRHSHIPKSHVKYDGETYTTTSMDIEKHGSYAINPTPTDHTIEGRALQYEDINAKSTV